MRIFWWSIALFVVLTVIKVDLQEGTLPLAEFYSEACEEDTYKTVQVKIQPGDTLYSLFATTPMEQDMSFSERLALFFRYNPHLQKQPLLAGDEVTLPLKRLTDC